MKRKIMISAVSFFVIMLLTGFMLDGRVSYGQDTVSRPETVYTDHIGTWRLTYDNDRVLDETFPDIYAFGSELTIRPEWFPGNMDHEIGGDCFVTKYSRNKRTDSPDYHCEMWLPVRKKNPSFLQ